MGFYFSGTFATRLLQLIFIPIYSKYVETSDLGTYNLTLSIISFSVPLLFQSIWEGGFRFAIENENNERKVLASITKYCLSLSIIYSLVFLIISYFIELRYGILILLVGIGQMGTSYWQYSARALKQNKIYSISTIVNSAIVITLNIVLIVIFKLGLVALFIANSAGNLVMVLILEYRLRLFKTMSQHPFDKKTFAQIIKYSFPLAINAISWWMFSSANNIVISSILGVDANGVFALALRFGSIFATITAVISMAWQEESFRTYENSNRDEYFNKVLNLLSRGLLGTALVLIPTTFLIYQFFVFGNYKPGVILTPIIYLGAVYNALSVHLGSAFLARKESHVMFYTTLAGGIISVSCSIIFAELFGLIGAVSASLLGYIITFFIRIPLLRKRIVLEIDYVILFSLTIFGIGIACVCNIYPASFFYQLFIFAITAGIALFVNKTLVISISNKVMSILRK